LRLPAAVREDESRADDEVPDRARHEHITGFRLRRDTCADVDGEAPNRCSVDPGGVRLRSLSSLLRGSLKALRVTAGANRA
jgi:hypothetical protein